MATSSWVEWNEFVVDSVSDWGNDYVDRMVEVLMPDGRPFGFEKLSQREELLLYTQELRGNPEGWRNWINTRVQEMLAMLEGFGFDQQTIAAVHPYDIVESAAVAYSVRMERRLGREQEKASRAALRPDAPEPELEPEPEPEVSADVLPSY